MARSKPWWRSCQWSVLANTDRVARTNPRPSEHKPGGWKEIYCEPTKARAQAHAKSWRSETGQHTVVVPGAGHKTRRNGIP